MRHPGYTGVSMVLIGIPLILGSVWALVPAAVAIVAFVVRTRYEDRLLHEELEGYAAYAETTRFRLLPRVW